MKNCNKRLVKIIDCNILKKIKTNSIEEMKRKDNLQLVKALIDKKLSKKILKKYNKALLDSDKIKLKSLYLVKNINDSEMSNNVIYNQCKSLSTNETNKGNKLVKHNSLITLIKYGNFFFINIF